MEDDAEFLDEDGRARLKLKVENTIRWRKSTGKDGRESNARVVQWTDGRLIGLNTNDCQLHDVTVITVRMYMYRKGKRK